MDNIKQNLGQLLAKPMDRREFLKHMGILVLAVMGIGRILQAFNLHHEGANNSPGGYGYIPYGGNKQ